jgi:type I restriction enzyme R subunit
MRDHIGASLTVEVDDFDYAPFVDEGGLGKARQAFGEELGEVMRESEATKDKPRRARRQPLPATKSRAR